MASNKCKDCGCNCNKCALSHDVHLHVEIENLKQRLVERENHIVTMETTFLNEADKYPNGEFVALREELVTWQDKYSRLYEAHKRVQKVNQSLEDKLLKLVDKTETEKSTLTKDVATLSHRLADANYTIQRLQGDNEKYKNDVNLAIQLLQCKPANFVSHRVDSLPNEVQAKVSSYVASRRRPPEDKKASTEVRSIKVPIPTFPPTAMVYSIPKTPSPEKDSSNTVDIEKPPVDIVSAAIMAKILEEREKERRFTKHCDSCTCSKNNFPSLINTSTHHSVATQTGNQKTSLCLRCNGDLTRSPISSMKIIKTLDNTSVPNKLNDSEPNMKTYPQNISYYDSNEKNTPKNNNLLKNKIAVSENSKVVVNAISDTFVKNTQKSIDAKSGHHRLCEQNSKQENDAEKIKKTAAKNNENVKGPRYCSMRVQSGSKNILLDNVHSNYPPVLYTRQDSNDKKAKVKENSDKATSIHLQSNSRTNSISSDDRKSLNLSECDNSYHKQQRVAEWVQNIDENDVSGSEHSKNENHSKRLHDFDAQQYAQIETNVKNFLFKHDTIKCQQNDSKSLKKNLNLKQKYHSLPQNDGSLIELKGNKNSHTETEI